MALNHFRGTIGQGRVGLKKFNKLVLVPLVESIEVDAVLDGTSEIAYFVGPLDEDDVFRLEVQMDD